MSQVKVLRVITRMNVGGPALHVQILTDGLARRGYKVVLASGKCQPGEGDLPAELPPGREMIAIDHLARSISPLSDLAAAWKLYRLMRRERPAVVHTHTAKAGMVGRLAACIAGVPVVVHTFHGNSLSGYFSPRVSAVLRGIEKLLARFTDCICVVSEQQEREIADHYRIAPRSKIRVVPLGLNLTEELQQPVAEPRDGVLRVGWLGRMVPIKGVPLLAAVIEETARRDLPVRFLVAGDGPEGRRLDDVAGRYGRERLQRNGWERDVRGFIGQCDLLIQTSANEGTPVALIQGMAAGRPFVSTAVGGVVDLVCGPGRVAPDRCRWHSNAVLTPVDPLAFADTLEHLVRHTGLLSPMGLAGRRFVEQRFQAERLVDDIDRLYKELIHQRLPVKAPYSELRKLTGESG
jgi:glycosyltransferase involved in cell wall biosynthesis